MTCYRGKANCDTSTISSTQIMARRGMKRVYSWLFIIKQTGFISYLSMRETFAISRVTKLRFFRRNNYVQNCMKNYTRNYIRMLRIYMNLIKSSLRANEKEKERRKKLKKSNYKEYFIQVTNSLTLIYPLCLFCVLRKFRFNIQQIIWLYLYASQRVVIDISAAMDATLHHTKMHPDA